MSYIKNLKIFALERPEKGFSKGLVPALLEDTGAIEWKCILNCISRYDPTSKARHHWNVFLDGRI